MICKNCGKEFDEYDMMLSRRDFEVKCPDTECQWWNTVSYPRTKKDKIQWTSSYGRKAYEAFIELTDNYMPETPEEVEAYLIELGYNPDELKAKAEKLFKPALEAMNNRLLQEALNDYMAEG